MTTRSYIQLSNSKTKALVMLGPISGTVSLQRFGTNGLRVNVQGFVGSSHVVAAVTADKSNFVYAGVLYDGIQLLDAKVVEQVPELSSYIRMPDFSKLRPALDFEIEPLDPEPVEEEITPEPEPEPEPLEQLFSVGDVVEVTEDNWEHRKGDIVSIEEVRENQFAGHHNHDSKAHFHYMLTNGGMINQNFIKKAVEKVFRMEFTQTLKSAVMVRAYTEQDAEEVFDQAWEEGKVQQGVTQFDQTDGEYDVISVTEADESDKTAQ